MNIVVQVITFIFVWVVLTTVEGGFRNTRVTTWKERLPYSFLATLAFFIAAYIEK